MKKVLLIYGGNSPEHDVSIKSAQAIKENIDKKKYILDSIYITKNNEWLYNNNKLDNIINFINKYDIVFPIIHGINGEDGKLQGMLELFNIKYVGSDYGSSYICMDKIRTKEILSNYDIPMLPYQLYEKNINIDYPVIIKPSNGGSSIGISIANNKKELNKSIKEAMKYDKKILIEKYINNPIELECAVLQDKNKLIVEIGQINHNSTFYDYKTKYENDLICTNLIPDIPDEIKKELINYSKKIFNILGLKGLARIDFFYYENKIYLNEINTLPGFTNISMYPMLLINHGISYSSLLTKLIDNT